MERQKTTQLWLDLIEDEKTTTTSRKALWANNDTRKDIQTPIGIHNENVVNAIINTTFYPHGVIIGMSGSGKSVALRTFALTTAALYSPNRVQFVYASAKKIDLAIKQLPHTIKTFNLQDKGRYDDWISLVGNLIEKREDNSDEENTPTIILLIDEPAASKFTNSNAIIKVMRQSRDVDIHCVIAAQNPKSIHASIYDNAGWTLMFNNIVSHPYKEILDEYHKDNLRNYTTGTGYLIEQHHNIQPVTIFDTSDTKWTLQSTAHSLLNYRENDGVTVVNRKEDNDKTFFFSLSNDPKRDEELCKQNNLKKINIMSSVRDGTLLLDPFFYTDDKQFIADILSRIIISSTQLNNGCKIRAVSTENDISRIISRGVHQEDIHTAFEAVMRSDNSIICYDEKLAQYIRNRIVNSSIWRAIFNNRDPEEGIGIESLCGEYDGILFVFDGDVLPAVDESSEEQWNVETRENVITASLVYNCVKNYIEHHGGLLVVDDNYYAKPLLYLSEK